MTIQSCFKSGKFSKSFMFRCLPIVYVCFMCHISYAQSFDSLTQLKGHQTQVYFSAGAHVKANRIAKQLDAVINFYKKQVEFTPVVTLLILSPSDWNKYAKSVVYGMPHYTDSKTLIVAAENNDFWKSFIPPLDKLPKEYAHTIAATYTDGNGGLSMEPFFDLLAIHELGHAYSQQASIKLQRNWMGELFSNIFLHSYIAESEPHLLDALIIFPKMVVSTTDKSVLKYTTLSDVETFYNEVAQQHPRNYGWYQCRWHMAAANIYETAGLAPFKKIWFTMKNRTEKLDDESFSDLLLKEVHQTVADVYLKWDEHK